MATDCKSNFQARSVPILSAVKNRYYKVTDGALRACGEVVRVLCPILEVILYSMSCGHEVPCCLIFIFFNFVVQTTSVVFRPYNSMWSITTCFGIDFKKTKNKCINMRKKLKKRSVQLFRLLAHLSLYFWPCLLSLAIVSNNCMHIFFSCLHVDNCLQSEEN